MIRDEGISGDGVVSADDRPEEVTAATRELRIALAMRGGVSLAVWIGGAVTEIERIRHHDDPGNNTYKSLLDLNGYDDVIIDVLSGASAGGLNGVVYSAAQVHGFDMGSLRDLWLKLGDIESLARPTTPGARAQSAAGTGRRLTRGEALWPDSLLRGDEYFYREMRNELAGLINAGQAPKTTPRLDLVLSATLFEPQVVKKLVNASTVVEDGRSGALFRFRQGPDRSDFFDEPGGDASSAARDSSTARLAMAARATSSFPFAFEPARIAVGSKAAEDAVDGLDFSDVFEVPATGSSKTPYRVIDGGVLDNIPVGAAIDAIVDAPASGPTDRWLCYLHPSPSRGPTEATPVQAQRPRSLATVLRTMATRFNLESLLEDIDELGLVNDVIARRQLVRDTVLAPYGDVGYDRLLEAVSEPGMRGRLTAILAQFEAHRVRMSLQRPDRLRIGPPIPFVSSWPASRQAALRTALRKRMEKRVDDLGAARTMTAQSEAIDLLIALAREIENRGSPAAAAQASRLKKGLYGSRSRSSAVLRGEAEVWIQAAVRDFPMEGRPGAEPRMTTWVQQTLDSAAQETQADLDRIRASIETAANGLASIDAELDAPFSLVQAAGEAAAAATVEALAVALLPARLVGRGPWTRISFLYVTGDAPTTIGFPRLEGDSGGLSAKEKLCGNELGNFAAFLSARWRANDWMWGRMDAASTLVAALTPEHRLAEPDFRTDLVRLAKLGPDATADEIRRTLRDRLQRDILDEELEVISRTPTSALDQQRSADHGTPLRADTLAIGRESLSDLGETRKVRVGMRLALVGFGTLRPSSPSLAAAMGRRALSLLKPLYLACLFAVLSPARAVLSIAIGVAAIQATFWQGEGDVELSWDELTIGLGVVAIGAAGVALARWATKSREDGGDSATSDSWFTTALTVALLLGAGAIVFLLRKAGAQYVALTLVGLGVIALSGSKLWEWRPWRDRAEGGATQPRLDLVLWLAAIGVAAAGIVLGWFGRIWEGPYDSWSDTRSLVAVLVVAAVAVLVLGNWWMRRWNLFLAVVMTVATGLGSLAVTMFRDETILGVGVLTWMWLAIGLVIVIFLSDVFRLGRFVEGSAWSAVGPGPVLAVMALLSLGLALWRFSLDISTEVWSVVAVMAVVYAITMLMTYSSVFPEPPGLDVGEARDQSQTGRGPGGEGGHNGNVATTSSTATP